MVVVGVDPGSLSTGYGIIEVQDGSSKYIACGSMRFSSKIPFYKRIHMIYRGMLGIIDRYRPHELAIEDVFYSKDIRGTLRLGQARGAVLIACLECDIRIFEYTPLEIKKALVGYGRATKEQVQSMVINILGLDRIDDLDASDALAAAICHANHKRFDKLG
ncbi:MAG TPA: crossover junction endodeoxyribonuclease RuvC [Desulfobacteraceae bacterium]|nr:crossover junction endodeoxyribonuclease RuvC [Desulfobacteraceae bacterium]